MKAMRKAKAVCSAGPRVYDTAMMVKPLSALAAVVVVALGACHAPDKTATKMSSEADGVKASVEVGKVWCRPTPNGAQAGACYFTIKSSIDNRLTGAATAQAASAAIHDMSMAGGVMRMSEMAGGLPLPAGKAVELKPGGKHLMLTGLTGPMVEGRAVAVTLTFDRTPAMTLQAPVGAPD